MVSFLRRALGLLLPSATQPVFTPAGDRPLATGVAVTTTATGSIVDLGVDGLADYRWEPITLQPGKALLLRSPVTAGQWAEITADWRAQPPAVDRRLSGSVRFFDAQGCLLPPPYAGCCASRPDPAFLVFPVSVRGTPAPATRAVAVPAGAVRIEVRWRPADAAGQWVLADTPRISAVVAAEVVGSRLGDAGRGGPSGGAQVPAGWRPPERFAVAAGDVLVWRARLEDLAGAKPKAAIVAWTMFDADGNPVNAALAGASRSARYANYFYVCSFRPDQPGCHLRSIRVPEGVATVQVDLVVNAGSAALRLVESDVTRLDIDTAASMARSWPPHRAWLDPAILLARRTGQQALCDELLFLLGSTARSTPQGQKMHGWHRPLRLPVTEGATVLWRARLRDANAPSPKAAIMTVSLLDAAGFPVRAQAQGLAHSDKHANYAYVEASLPGEGGWYSRSFVVPAGVAELEVDLRRHQGSAELTIVDEQLIPLDVAAVRALVREPEPDPAWLGPAIRVAQQAGELDLVRDLVAALERARYGALPVPQGWVRPANTQVSPGLVVIWRARLVDEVGPNPKAAVMSPLLYDADGALLQARVEVLAHSPRYANYLYVPAFDTAADGWQYKSFVVPEGVAEIGVMLHRHGGSEALRVIDAELTVLTLATARAMAENWLPDEAWLVPAVQLTQAEGALTLHERLLFLLARLQATRPETVRRWRAIRADLDELDPAWFPRLAVSARPLDPPERLTVCHLHKTAYPFENTGGAIRCLNTLKSQRAEGIDAYVVTPPGYPASAGVLDGGVQPHEVVEGCDHFRIGPNTPGVKFLSPMARVQLAAVQSAAIVVRRGASLVHAASGVRGYELALQAFALRDAFGIPAIYEVRSFHEHTWAPADPRVLDLERTQLRIRKENQCMAMADHVVTISDSMRRILIERGVPEEKIDVVPNAIDEEEFREAPPPARIDALQGAQLVVGYISNMSRREGHRHLIEAVARLRAQGLDCRCLLVGDGPERRALQAMVDESGLAGVVHFVGEVDHHEIKAYYMAIDVFVVPRIPDYAADWVTPLKPYEAMALGRPLIVTDLPALHEVVGGGERGLIAEPASAESLVAQIHRYAVDDTLRQGIAARAREWVFQHRTWRANAQRYREIYERVLAQHGARRRSTRNPDVRTG